MDRDNEGSIAFLLAMAVHLQSVRWVARDVVFLFTETDDGARKWLEDYHSPVRIQRSGLFKAKQRFHFLCTRLP